MTCATQPKIVGSCLSRRALLGGIAAGAGAGCLSGCSTNPATGGSMLALQSIDGDVQQGTQAYPQMMAAMGGEYDNPRLARYVTTLGNKLAQYTELPDLPYEFRIANTPIVNASALPGGKIAITRGLLALASDEAELAGVMAHEIGHVNARHSAARQGAGMLAQLGAAILGAAAGSKEVGQLGQTLAAGYVQSYSREQEFEADMLGVRYSSRAGYDPGAMARFLASLREYSLVEARRHGQPEEAVDQGNMMASHPRTIDRVQAAMAQAGAQAGTGSLNRDDYLGVIGGMMYGDDPRQGLVLDRTFIHPDLRITFTAPPGFVLSNGTEQVVGKSPDQAFMIFDLSGFDQARTPLEHLVYEWGKGLPLQNARTIRIKAGTAAVANARVQQGNTVLDVRMLAIERSGQSVFRFMFGTPANLTQRYTTAFGDTVDSIRLLSAAEAAEITPMTLLVVPRHPDDTVAALARSLPFGAFNEDMFRVLNDLENDGDLAARNLLKIVAR